MSTISYREFDSRLKKGFLDKVYLFSGRDKDKKDEAIDRVVSLLRTSCEGSLTVLKVRSEETSSEVLAAHLFTVPLFEKLKLVVVPGVEDLGKEAQDLFIEFAQTPPEGQHLVLYTDLSSWELKKRRRAFLSMLGSYGCHIDFSPPREGELKRRALSLCQKLGFRIEGRALEKVLTMTGNDFENVKSELEKLSLFLPPGGKAGETEVEMVVSRSEGMDVWALADAVSRRDGAGAVKILNDLLRSGEKPVQIVGALWYNMVRMAWCRDLLDSGVDEGEIGRELKLQKWVLRNYLQKAGRFSREEYRAILDILFDFDVAVRTRGGSVEPVFSRGVAEMVRGLGKRGERWTG